MFCPAGDCGNLDHLDHLEVVDLASLLLHPTSDVVQFRLVNLENIMVVMILMSINLQGDDETFLLHSATRVSANLPVLSIL